MPRTVRVRSFPPDGHDDCSGVAASHSYVLPHADKGIAPWMEYTERCSNPSTKNVFTVKRALAEGSVANQLVEDGRTFPLRRTFWTETT